MIFVLHYILFNAGLSAILILLTLFLQTYSDASLTEIGALLMVLPFVSIVVKPLFCALADRHQAHKHYLTGSVLLMGLGYGSLAIAPFFPDFYKQHGRLVWYLDAIGIVVGFCAFGVTWSLGDALAVNAARVKNVPWGSIRVWATISWGVFGLIIGEVNEIPALPKYVPAFLILTGALLLEAVLLLFWSNEPFDMSAEQQQPEGDQKTKKKQPQQQQQQQDLEMELNEEAHWPNASSLSGTLNGSARLNPRLMGAMANFLMEDIGGSIKSSLKRGQTQKRTALADILEQHQLQNTKTNGGGGGGGPLSSQQSSPAMAGKWQHSPIQLNRSTCDSSSITGLSQQQPASGTLGRAALRRTQRIFSPMNSLSSASGHAIADQLKEADFFNGCDSPQPTQRQQRGGRAQVMTMSSLASHASLSKATAAARAIGQSTTKGELSMVASEMGDLSDSFTSCSLAAAAANSKTDQAEAKSVEELQMILLKLIVRRDRDILKFLVLFTLFGILFTIHNSYFFLHVEQVCRAKGYDFSSVTGAMVGAQSLSEIVCFLVIVPYVIPVIGRRGAFLASALMFALRYAFYATYYIQLSPYSALATETMHGFAYGIIYTLITDIATECVNQVDDYVPELVQRRIIQPHMDPNQLKLPLRATMQGVFSGAFDGLGNGIGALAAGIYLDSKPPYTSLWLLCAYMSAAIALIYILTEWRAFCGLNNRKQQEQQQQQPEELEAQKGKKEFL